MSSILKYTLAVLATAVIVGGGTYYLVNRQATNDKNSLNSQVSSLQSQVKSLNKKVTSLSSTTSSTGSTNPTSTTDIKNAQQAANTFMTDMTAINSSVTSTTTLETDRSNVLSAFTAPQTTAETSDFAFLTGTDSGIASTTGIAYPNARVLGGTSGFSYTLTNFTIGTGTESNGTVTFPITETRNSWNGSAYVNTTITTYLDLIQGNSAWTIENYYIKNFSATTGDQSGQQAASLKYSAF